MKHPKVIDVDSHWAVPWEFRLDERPLRRWSAKFPGEVGELAADALRGMVPHIRPAALKLFAHCGTLPAVHPKLTMPVSELVVFWLPNFVGTMDMMSVAGSARRLAL